MCLCLKRSLPHHIVFYIGGIKLSVCLSVYIILFDRFEFSTHQLCENKQDKKYIIYITSFLICGSELLNLLILCDLGAETSISGVYCSSSDL